jgi:hypothetical protein
LDRKLGGTVLCN